MMEKKYTFKKGAYIYVEGDEDVESVFILVQGEIQLVQSNKNIQIYKSILRNGDIFGFITSLSNHPRTESALALKETTVIEMTRDHFLSQLQNNSELAFKVISYFSEYLRSYDDMIFASEFKEDTLPVETRFFNTGSYYYNTDSYEIAYYIFMKLMQLYPANGKAGEVREYITNIERSGFRAIAEPIKEGIYFTFADRQVIFCEDEPGEELFIIKEGRVKIVKVNLGTEVMLSVLNEGDIFGEMALVSHKPRNATAVAYGNTMVLPINRASLSKLIARSPQILKRIFTSISQRVWFTHIRLDAKTYKQPLTRLYAFLETKLLEESVSLKTETPYTCNFGIDELLKMAELSPEKNKGSIEELLKDSNLSFNFGKIGIASVRALSARAQYHRSRDHISSGDEISPVQNNADNQLKEPKIAAKGTVNDNIGKQTENLAEELNALENIPFD